VRWVTLTSAVLGFLTAVIGFALLFRRVQAIHVLVNSNLTKVMDKLGIEVDRNAMLKGKLDDAGIPVPPREDKP
jgi:hypothetical protein